MIKSHLLSILTFLPMFGGLVVFFLKDKTSKWAAFGISLLTFLLSILLWTDFDRTSPNLDFVERRPWIPEFGVAYHVGVDGLSVLLVLLTTFLMPITILGSFTYIQKKVPAYMALMLLLQGTMTGALWRWISSSSTCTGN